MKRVYIYRAYERFWHWAQSLIVFLLIATGFEIHGSFDFFGYQTAVDIHNTTAIAFIILTVFTIFWHITTGEWKHYVPTSKKLKAQTEFYLFGIFKNAPLPIRKTLLNKLNPLQRIVYFGLKTVLIPLLILTGIIYIFYRYSHEGEIKALNITSLETIAYLHTIGAYLIVAFIIAHIYLISTGHSLSSHMRAMLTGFEDVEDEEADKCEKDKVEEVTQNKE